MQATIKLFGPLAQMAGRSELTLALEGNKSTCAALRQRLSEAEPALAAFAEHGRFAVNFKYVGDQHVITDADEIALITMISGG